MFEWRHNIKEVTDALLELMLMIYQHRICLMSFDV